MKKIIAAAVAASMLATPVMAATPGNTHQPTATQHDNRNNDRSDHRSDIRYGQKDRNDRNTHGTTQRDDRRNGVQNRGWQRGQHFDQRYARNYRAISTPASYRLGSAPSGYHWVQSGNDAVLVGLATGIIAAVMVNAIR